MIDLEGIRARDAKSKAVWFRPDAVLETLADVYRDRRALLAYVKALRAAAGKVTCKWCSNTGVIRGNTPPFSMPCPDCADLRRLTKEAGR